MITLDFLVLLGALILAIALIPSFLITIRLPSSPTKKYWIVLSFLIFFFIIGYILFFFVQEIDQFKYEHLIVPLVFFSGACFVFLISFLSLHTLQAIQKIDILEKENITDPLMSIYNRRCFEDRLKEEISRAKRYGLTLSLILIDIDNFKNINDSYGHHTADLVLKKIGSILSSSIRDVDIPARYGGDEIAIISPNNDQQEAVALGLRLRNTIADHDFCNDISSLPPSFHCTISVGVAAFDKNHHYSEDLLKSADRALYEAKARGRNQVCSYGECVD